MTVYSVYLTGDNENGVPQSLQDWDEDEGTLVLYLHAFARDAVITIEPKTDQP